MRFDIDTRTYSKRDWHFSRLPETISEILVSVHLWRSIPLESTGARLPIQNAVSSRTSAVPVPVVRMQTREQPLSQPSGPETPKTFLLLEEHARHFWGKRSPDISNPSG